MPETIADVLSYYTQQGIITEPGEQAGLFEGLPRDIPSLCQVVQGVMLHVFWAEQYGVKLSDERRAEVQLRHVSRRLARIHELAPLPLAIPRPPEERSVGNCRDFSTLLCSILRSQGVPARTRCGFGTYFIPDHYEEHWVGM